MACRIIKSSDYFVYDAVNSSLLKQLKNPKWVKFYLDNPDRDSEEKRAFRVGGALDAILTQPENFNKEYGVLTESRPGGLMGIFIDNLDLSIHQDSPQEAYQEAYQKSGYKRAIEVVINSLWDSPKNLEYFMGRKRNQGKIILGIDEYDSLLHAQEKLINNAYTRRYFSNQNSDEILLHQVGIVFDYRDVHCKALLDGILIDKKNKVIELFDLKQTSKSVYSFIGGNYLMYMYYIQAAMYYVAVEQLLKNNPNELKKLSPYIPNDIADYKLQPMKFIVAESKVERSNPAIIYRTSPFDLVNAIHGFFIRDREYVGLNELIDDYKWHTKNNAWEFPRKLYESKGVIDLNLSYDVD
jgi:hypothetical protein